MKNKMILGLLLVTVVGSTSILANTNMAEAKTNQSIIKNQDVNLIEKNEINNVDDFMNTELAKEFNAEKLDKTPKNVEVANFDTWTEAYEYLENIEVESEKIEKESKEYLERTGKAVPTGVDRFVVKPVSRPTGSTTKTYTVSLDVPGLSAQDVVSEHTISFRDKKIVSSNRGSYITGLGLANWSPYYSGLENYNTTEDSVVKGKCGYFISVGGVQVGVSKKWALVIAVNK